MHPDHLELVDKACGGGARNAWLTEAVIRRLEDEGVAPWDGAERRARVRAARELEVADRELRGEDAT